MSSSLAFVFGWTSNSMPDPGNQERFSKCTEIPKQDSIPIYSINSAGREIALRHFESVPSIDNEIRLRGVGWRSSCAVAAPQKTSHPFLTPELWLLFYGLGHCKRTGMIMSSSSATGVLNSEITTAPERQKDLRYSHSSSLIIYLQLVLSQCDTLSKPHSKHTSSFVLSTTAGAPPLGCFGCSLWWCHTRHDTPGKRGDRVPNAPASFSVVCFV